MTARKIFLCDCRRNGIFPTHVTNALTNVYGLFNINVSHANYVDRVMLKFKRMALNAEIKVTHWDLSTVGKEMSSIGVQIRSSNCDLLDQFIENQERFFLKKIISLGKRHLKKFNSIQASLSGIIPYDEHWIVNLTDVQVPENVSHLLSLGQKFALPYRTKKDIPMARLLAETEDMVQAMECTNDDKNAVRSRITNHIMNYTYKREPKNPLEKWLASSTKALREFLKNHDDIIIASADKGGKTVVLMRDVYETKMSDLLSDTSTYKPIKKDLTSHFQTKNNDLARRLHSAGYIDAWTKSRLTTYKALPPRIYGLPKIHKTNVPLRPIISCVGSPTHDLSRFVNDILKNITECSQYKLKNSYDFISRIKNLILNEDEILVSFDVVSLFTNIPRGLAMEIIERKWDSIRLHTDIPLTLFREMLSLVMDSGYFKYQDKFYHQTAGMPMGNCVSPAVADVTVDHVIDTAIESTPHPPRVVFKYVDDLFLVVRACDVNSLLEHFNSIHENIKFTHELERDRELPFLDTVVRRNEDGTLTANWYQKPMASGRILNFASLHPMKQKINTAEGLIHRVRSLTTDPQTNTSAIIVNVLSKNNYPRHIIEKLLERRRSERDVDNQNNSFHTIAETKFCSMTYIKGLSEKISKTIRSHSQDITVCLKSYNTVGQFFTKTKDPIPMLDKTNLIYRIPCECGSFYVGRTSRKFRTRIREHELSVKKVPLADEDSILPTSLLQHMKKEKHKFSFNDASIVDVAPKSHQLNYMEAFYINAYQRAGKCVNHRNEGFELNQLYSALIPRTVS